MMAGVKLTCVRCHGQLYSDYDDCVTCLQCGRSYNVTDGRVRPVSEDTLPLVQVRLSDGSKALR